MIERYFNKTRDKSPYALVSEQAQQVHAKLSIIDLHADSLLWKRDFLQHNNQGHVDLPRQVEGNLALQVFGVVTQFPLSSKLNLDIVTFLTMLDGWPARSWTNQFDRAVYQAIKLKKLVKRSAGKMLLINSVADVEHCMDLQKKETGIVDAVASPGVGEMADWSPS